MYFISTDYKARIFIIMYYKPLNANLEVYAKHYCNIIVFY